MICYLTHGLHKPCYYFLNMSNLILCGYRTSFISLESLKLIDCVLWSRMWSALVNIPCVLENKKNILELWSIHLFYKFQLFKSIDSIQIFNAITNFLSTCFVSYWEENWNLQQYCGFVYFCLQICLCFMLLEISYLVSRVWDYYVLW